MADKKISSDEELAILKNERKMHGPSEHMSSDEPVIREEAKSKGKGDILIKIENKIQNNISVAVAILLAVGMASALGIPFILERLELRQPRRENIPDKVHETPRKEKTIFVVDAEGKTAFPARVEGDIFRPQWYASKPLYRIGHHLVITFQLGKKQDLDLILFHSGSLTEDKDDLKKQTRAQIRVNGKVFLENFNPGWHLEKPLTLRISSSFWKEGENELRFSLQAYEGLVWWIKEVRLQADEDG